ncbi:GGDEF domain-containing protein [Paenibacillus agricola]|nr:GGDEF domain-containing protein [Paenibacillus agricola]
MAITLFDRNKNSSLNRVAALLMLSFLFYFLGEYIKTSLLPQYQMQIVLYGSAPMLLLMISSLVHLCLLVGSPVTLPMQRMIKWIYAAPFTTLIIMLLCKDHTVLFNSNITDGRSPLDPLFLLLTLMYVGGYILLSVVILAVSLYRTREAKRRGLLGSLLLSLFALFAWFVIVTMLLVMKFITSRESMVLYFIGYLLWAVALRHLIGKHDFLPDYRKLFHILFESAPTAILLLDKKGGVREMNPRAKQLFVGYPSQRISEVLMVDETMSLKDRLALFIVERGKEARWEISLTHSDTSHLDLIAGLDVLEETGEELLVMHLTDITSLKEAERRLMESEQNYKYLAHHDALTGLYNRAAIQEQLHRMIRAQEPFALVLIDLDNFKLINDTYGHLVGDHYLKHIAALMKDHTIPGEFVGRLGGDEFIQIIPGIDDAADFNQEAYNRITSLFKHPYDLEGTALPVTFSAGVSFYPKHAADITDLLWKADEAMYTVKRRGKNEISVYAGY